MDNYAEAFNSLNDLIHELYTNQPYKKPIFLSEMEHFRQTAIPIKLENIVNEIRRSVYNTIYTKSLNLHLLQSTLSVAAICQHQNCNTEQYLKCNKICNQRA